MKKKFNGKKIVSLFLALTLCLGAFMIVPTMFRAKSSRCRVDAVRVAASCDMCRVCAVQ